MFQEVLVLGLLPPRLFL